MKRDVVRIRVDRQRGTILVQFALFVFAFFAIAATAVDLGVARFSQLAMQGAADAAALEGMRVVDATDDATRRAIAAALVSRSFDDDLDPSNGDELALGAGPTITLENGLAGIQASALLSVDPGNPAAYDPNLEPNLLDLPHGDMVAGTFVPGELDPVESADYTRADFSPGASDSAFLVRLRRTNDPLGLDEQAGVSSSAPTLPYLFALGSLIAPESRVAGITVRATSIASTRPTVSIATDPAVFGPALVDLALHRSELPPVDVPQSLAIQANGTLVRSGGGPVVIVGEFVASEEPAFAPRPSVVGVRTDRVISVPLATAAEVILPVISLEVTTARRVVGFVVASIEVTGPSTIVLTRRASIVAPHGSARSARAWGRLAANPNLLAQHLGIPDAVRSPVLVR